MLTHSHSTSSGVLSGTAVAPGPRAQPWPGLTSPRVSWPILGIIPSYAQGAIKYGPINGVTGKKHNLHGARGPPTPPTTPARC